MIYIMVYISIVYTLYKNGINDGCNNFLKYSGQRIIITLLFSKYNISQIVVTRWGTTVQICKLGVFFAILSMKEFSQILKTPPYPPLKFYEKTDFDGFEPQKSTQKYFIGISTLVKISNSLDDVKPLLLYQIDGVEFKSGVNFFIGSLQSAIGSFSVKMLEKRIFEQHFREPGYPAYFDLFFGV